MCASCDTFFSYGNMCSMQNSHKLFLKVKWNNKVNMEGQEDKKSEFICYFLKQGISFPAVFIPDSWGAYVECRGFHFSLVSHRINLLRRSISIRTKLDLRLSSCSWSFAFSRDLCGLLLWLWTIREAKYFPMLLHPGTPFTPLPNLPVITLTNNMWCKCHWNTSQLNSQRTGKFFLGICLWSNF